MLVAAVTVVGVLCLLNLLLLFGVIRRLREHTEMLGRFTGSPPALVGLDPGEPAAAFAATATGGEPVTGPAGLRAVGFFSSSCSICPERVGPFLDYLGSHQIPREQALCVVTGLAASPPPYAQRLAEGSMVCVEAEDGEIERAFKIQGFPVFCLLDGSGRVLASSYDPAKLPLPATAQ